MTSTHRTLRLAVALAALVVLLPLPPAAAESHEGMDLPADVEAILASITEAGDKLISLAEATPADKFSWAPTDEVRTISEVYMHVVGVNLLLPNALGAAPPEGLEIGDNPFALMGEWEKTVTAKDDVIAKLKESLHYVHGALASVKDLDTEVSLFGPPQSKRAYLLIVMAHAHEHLGQSIAYARTAGVVPPWSQPAPEADGADGADAGGQ